MSNRGPRDESWLFLKHFCAVATQCCCRLSKVGTTVLRTWQVWWFFIGTCCCLPLIWSALLSLSELKPKHTAGVDLREIWVLTRAVRSNYTNQLSGSLGSWVDEKRSKNARCHVNCRTHERRHFERKWRPSVLNLGPHLAEGRFKKSNQTAVITLLGACRAKVEFCLRVVLLKTT